MQQQASQLEDKILLSRLERIKDCAVRVLKVYNLFYTNFYFLLIWVSILFYFILFYFILFYYFLFGAGYAWAK